MSGEFLYNNSVALILGLMVLTIIGYGMYRLQKKNPNMKLGELLATQAVDDFETITMGGVIAAFLFSAVLAATLQPPGEAPPNVLARLGVHTTISFIGAACTLTAVRDAVTPFKKDIDGLQRFFSSLVFLFVFTVSMGVPVLNLILIAAGLDEDIRIQLFLIDWLRSEETFQYALASYGLSKDYNTWNGMSYLLKSEVGITVLHYLLTLIEAFRNVADPERRKVLLERKSSFGIANENDKSSKDKNEKSKEKDDKSDAMEGEKRSVAAAKDNIKYLLIRFKYESDALNNQIKNAWTRLDEMDDSFKFKMAARLGNIVTKFKTYDSSPNKNKDDERKLLKLAREFFEGKLSETNPDKKGLGLTIKGNLGK